MDILYYFLINPRGSIRRVTESKPLHLGLIIIMLMIVSSAIAENLIYGYGGEFLGIQLSIFFIIYFLFMVVGIFFEASTLHFVACSMGGGGSPRSLYVLLCLSRMPFLLAGPMALALHRNDDLGKMYFGVTMLILFIWNIYLICVSLQEQYRYSMGKAVATLIIGWMMFMFLGALLFVGLPIALIIAFFLLVI